jgi:polysaccharide biosynthesis protein PslG
MKNQAKLRAGSFLLKVAIVAMFAGAVFFSPPAANAASASSLRGTAAGSSRSTPIGISYGDTLVWDSSTVLSQTLDDAVAVGITTIRLDLGWNDIQPASATIDRWDNFDRVVRAARARRLTLLPILAYTPAWARPAGCTTAKCAPADPNAFASFAATAAGRYAPMGIHTWEIWNEPNIVNFWQPTPNSTQYVNLLRASSNAIRTADPQAFIISGGLAPTGTSQGNIAQLDFFSQFANQGGINLVNAIGYHSYSYPVLPGYNASWNAWQKMFGTSLSIESILATHGGASKKIWITEYGAPTNGPGAGATLSNYNLTLHPDHVDEALEAQMANDSVRLARASHYIGALYWYSYKNLGTNKADNENFFGLREFDGSTKPAWRSFRNAIIATN